MSFVDFHEFRDVGLFRDDVEYDRGMLITPDGTQLRANFDDPEQRRQIAQACLGERLRNGMVADAGFFFGPKGFYAGAAHDAGRRATAVRDARHQFRQRAVRPRMGAEGGAAPPCALRQHDR